MFQQLLRLCTAALALGTALLIARGVPKPTSAPGTAHVCAATQSTVSLSTPWIEQSEARTLLGDPGVMFVDCRPRDQFQAGHISGAVSLPSDRNLPPATVDTLRAARSIIAYCDARGGCESSQRLAARLREYGLTDVRILKDGLPGWLQAGYPAESGPCRLCNESNP